MSNSSENSGGTQPEGCEPKATEPVVTKFTTRAPDERTGGITKLKGKASFTSVGGVSINVKVDGGSTTGTSDFKAAGAQGDSVANGSARQPATLNATTERVTASGLATASATKNYTVQVSFKLTQRVTENGQEVTRETTPKLNGTIKKANITFGQDSDVTLE